MAGFGQVGSGSDVACFVSDCFLRRIDRKRRAMPDGTLSWEVFQCRNDEASLSFTNQNEQLVTHQGLVAYQIAKRLKSGDLPGICKLTLSDLTEGLQPPLPPRQQKDETDPEYGHLHCVTDCPRSQIRMERMAMIATQHGLVRPFISKKDAECLVGTLAPKD